MAQKQPKGDRVSPIALSALCSYDGYHRRAVLCFIIVPIIIAVIVSIIIGIANAVVY
jgi:hypothetical protein